MMMITPSMKGLAEFPLIIINYLWLKCQFVATKLHSISNIIRQIAIWRSEKRRRMTVVVIFLLVRAYT